MPYKDPEKRRISRCQTPERHRHLDLVRKYGITSDQYDILAEAQNYKCACCGKTPIRKKRHPLCVDHDHITGRVRGLLCGKCNHGLGQFDDCIENLERAIKYLKGD